MLSKGVLLELKVLVLVDVGVNCYVVGALIQIIFVVESCVWVLFWRCFQGTAYKLHIFSTHSDDAMKAQWACCERETLSTSAKKDVVEMFQSSA